MKVVSINLRSIELSSTWWNNLSIKLKREYLKKYPDSKYATGFRGSIEKHDAKETKAPYAEHEKKVKATLSESAKETTAKIVEEVGDTKLVKSTLDKMEKGEELTSEEEGAKEKIVKLTGKSVALTVGSVAAIAFLGPFALVVCDEYMDYRNQGGDSGFGDNEGYTKTEDDNNEDETTEDILKRNKREGDEEGDDEDPDSEPIENEDGDIDPDSVVIENEKDDDVTDTDAEVTKEVEEDLKSIEKQVDSLTAGLFDWIKIQDPDELKQTLEEKYPDIKSA